MRTLCEYHCKYFSIMFWHPKEYFWNWECYIPKWQNWDRFILNTPIFLFSVSGWIFFGKKPKGL